MRQKAISSVIITAMILHCAARLGLLEHVYGNRDHIALFFGVTKEIPIAVCSSEYDFSSPLSFQEDNSDNVPISIVHPEEINLFFQTPFKFEPRLGMTVQIFKSSFFSERVLKSPSNSIFHPPSIHS